jgi:class 3 adenylate cyclase/tetratricopeptide (TPR) repeat protein
MTDCSACGRENKPGRRFCAGCGSPLAATCPSCGSPYEPDERFCGDCGSALPVGGAAPGSTPVTGAEPSTPASRPGHTRGQPSPAAVAERRFVSILFADLVGFTPFAEERDPEQVRDLLTRYFEATRTVIERHGGSVEKFIGDAVMAAWGAPVAQEDDAERAVRAGLEVIDAVRNLGERFEARVGVLTGEAAVTLHAQGEGMVAGDLVNTAARLQSVAPPGVVLVGEATMRAAAAAVAFEPLGEQVLKGKQAPVPAWIARRVIGDRGGRQRAEGIEPQFVGRELELRLLKDLLHATGSEQRPRLVSITGPAGIGKSRLAWEFEKYLDGLVEPVFWHRGRSPSYGEGIAFWALGEMVRRRADLREEDDEATTRARIAATVERYVPDPADRGWVEPALLTLLGVEPPPAGGRERLFAAWRIFFERVAAGGTTVLLFEDLQWADAGQLDFIDHVMEWSRGVPLLVVTLARPELLERRPGWGTTARSFNAVGLEPLTESQMRELLLGLAPDLPDPVVSRILARAGGIPLYAVETVRMLVADGRLVPAGDGRFQPAGEMGELAVPDTLRALVASRLDALKQEDRELIQHAAVLGQSFTTAALHAVTGIDGDVLEARLHQLVRREVLEVSADPRSPERGQYGFVQSVIREVAYETLSRRDRRARHQAAARYFEGLGDDEIAGALATHYLAAYESSDPGPEADALQAQARVALRRAADRAVALGSPQQAAALLRQALRITSAPGERAELLERAAVAADHAGLYEDAEGFAREAIDTFRAAGRPADAARAIALTGGILTDGQMITQAAAFLEGALASVDGADDAATRADILARLSRVLMRLGRHGEAIERAESALELAEPRGLERVVAEAFVNKGSSLSAVGRWREGAALVAAGIDLAAATGDLALEMRARNNLGATLFRDDGDRLLDVLRETHELATRVGATQMALWVGGTRATIEMGVGRDGEAPLRLLEELLSSASARSDRTRLGGMLASLLQIRGDDWRARAPTDEDRASQSDPDAPVGHQLLLATEALLEGRFDEAWSASRDALGHAVQAANLVRAHLMRVAIWAGDAARAREALAEVEAEPESGPFIDAQREWAHGAVAALEGRREEARARLRDSVRRFDTKGWRLDGAQARLDAVLLLPDVQEAAGWADEAREHLQAIGARPWLAKLEEVTPQRVG